MMEEKLRDAIIDEYDKCADLEHSIVKCTKTKVSWVHFKSPYSITVVSVLSPIDTCIRIRFYKILSDLMLNIDYEK